MEVLINNCPIEFELEGEKTVSDIVNSISVWTSERDLVFNEVDVDDRRYQVEQLPDIELHGVKNINCIVRSRADLIFSTIDEGARYCDRVLSFIGSLQADADCKELENLAHGIDWLADVLLMVVHLIGYDPASVRYRDRTLSEHVDSLKSLRMGITSPDDGIDVIQELTKGADLFGIVKEIFRMIMISQDMKDLIMKSIDSPDVLLVSLKEMRDQFPEELHNIEKTAVAFQTGKDRDGTERLNRFIDFLFRYSRTCHQIAPVFNINLGSVEVDGVSLEEKNNRLKELLDETTRVMEQNDIISLTDILEYEIKPYMENLPSYMDLLLRKLSG